MALNKKKSCAVCFCESNEDTTPDKVFVILTNTEELRKRWHLAVFGRYEHIKTRHFVCEDHFNMQEDMENWINYKLTGSRLKVKETMVPHLNMDGQVQKGSQLSPACKKRQRSFINHMDTTKEKYVKREPEFCSVGTSLNFDVPEEEPVFIEELTCQIKPHRVKIKGNIIQFIQEESQTPKLDITHFDKNSHNDYEVKETQNQQKDNLKEDESPNLTLMSQLHIDTLNKNPKKFLGINQEVLQGLQYLTTDFHIPIPNIYLTLEKLHKFT